MRISQKQAELLAFEIHAKLSKQKGMKVSELTVAKLEEFYETRVKMRRDIDKAKEAMNKHDMTLKSITGNRKGIYADQGVAGMVRELEKQSTPSTSDIRDKIILKSMFANADDMEAFVESIVKEYTKKKLTVNI